MSLSPNSANSDRFGNEMWTLHEPVAYNAFLKSPHGCVYCFANINKERAMKQHRGHDSLSAFLGYSRAESDAWVRDMTRSLEVVEPKVAQTSLF